MMAHHNNYAAGRGHHGLATNYHHDNHHDTHHDYHHGAAGRDAGVGAVGGRQIPPPRSPSPGKLSHPDHQQITREDGITLDWRVKRPQDAPEVAIVTKMTDSQKSGYASALVHKFFGCFQLICKSRVNDGGLQLNHFKPIEGRSIHTLEYVHHLSTTHLSAQASNTSLTKSMTPPKVSANAVSPAPAVNLAGTKATAAADNRSIISSSRNSKQPGAPRDARIESSTRGGDTRSVKSAASTTYSHRSVASNLTFSGNAKNKSTKHEALGEFYDVAYHTLMKLQRSINDFKHIIFTLTFTRYAEDWLTDSEKKLTKGKSIVGSYMWIIVHALQQLEDDPEFEFTQTATKLNASLHELAVELVVLLNLSFQTWNEVVNAFGALEYVHKKAEDMFHKQNLLFQSTSPDQETAQKASLHLKRYRRKGDDLNPLKSVKFDPYANLLIWKKSSTGSSRILYKFNYADPSQLWQGFDPLPPVKKIATLREFLEFVRLILQSVKDAARNIENTLLKHPTHTGTTTPNNPNTPQNQHGHYMPTFFSRPQPTTPKRFEVGNFEEGIDKLEEILGKKLIDVKWRLHEMNELFETDKIFLDDLDILTLGAGLSRAILHEARHQIHICYETCRLLDFPEFSNLPTYEKLYHRTREEQKESDLQHNAMFLQYHHHNKKFKKGSLVTTAYDIEESNLELRNVAGLFRTSAYHDILVALPVFTHKVGLTLQESEAVFTPSSEKLLTAYKDPLHE